MDKKDKDYVSVVVNGELGLIDADTPLRDLIRWSWYKRYGLMNFLRLFRQIREVKK